MKKGEYELKQIVCLSLSNIFDKDKTVLEKLLNVNELC